MAKSFSKGSGNETRYNALARQTRGGGDRGGRGGRGGGRGGDRGGRGGRGGDRGDRGGDRGGRGGGGGEEREGRIGNRPGKKTKRVKASDFDGQSFYGGKKMIMFDREKRVEFVTGFKKRKDERREYAKQAMKEEAKQDRKETERVKQQQRQTVEEQYEQLRQLKRAESGLPPEEMTDNEDADEGENGDLESQSEKSAAILSDGDGGMFEKE